MITFFPMFGYRASLQSLDDQRLNKQVLECSQIIDTIMDETRGYQNHPAVTMWRENVLSLCNYGAIAALTHSDRRGNGITHRQVWFAQRATEIREGSSAECIADWALTPPWVGDIWFHRSHRSRLIEKAPLYYNGWGETPESMPYLWPVATSRDTYDLYIAQADVPRLESGERILPEQLHMAADRKVTVRVELAV